MCFTNASGCGYSIHGNFFGQWLWHSWSRVAFHTRCLQFESSHRQRFYWTYTVNYVEKIKIKKKRGRKWPIICSSSDTSGQRSRNLSYSRFNKWYLIWLTTIPDGRFAISISMWEMRVVKIRHLGIDGGQVVSMLAFYSDNLISNPAAACSFFCKICVWIRRK